MQTSTEVRWFFRDKNEIKQIEDWFAVHGLVLQDDQFDRQDYYMKLPGVSNLGLKIREPKKTNGGWQGKLEAKVFLRELHFPELDGMNAGKANQWTKFSFALPTGESTLTEILNGYGVVNNPVNTLDSNHWTRVDKTRILLKYDLEKRELTKDNKPIDEGCGIELTAIKLENDIYFSFALESFSGTGKQEHNFIETIHFIFSQLKTSGLRKENSLTYPEFLLTK